MTDRFDQPYDPAATVDDIYHCFRLILGRNPSAAEWVGHSALAGNDLQAVVRSYVVSPEFASRRLIARDDASRIELVRAPGCVIYAANDDLAVGKFVAAGRYEPAVTALMRSRLKPGMNVIDVGANIGYFTMVAASLVGAGGMVLAVEPNLDNVRMIEASRRANGFEHVVVAACGVGAATGILALQTAFSNGITGPVGEALADLMAARIVPCVPLSALWPADRRIDFVKIDVEGAEHAALAASRDLLARWRPLIASEFSPGLLQANSAVSGEDYLGFFVGLGYRMFVVDGSDVPAEATVAAVMEAYARCGGDHIDLLLAP